MICYLQKNEYGHKKTDFSFFFGGGVLLVRLLNGSALLRGGFRSPHRCTSHPKNAL
jgi:hypothetical protein